MSAKRVYLDTLRSIAFGSISASYAVVGGVLTVNPRIITIINQTQGNLILSDDNTNATGKMFLPASYARVIDLTANIIPGKDDSFVIAEGTQFYIKQLTAPVSGSVYIEIIYA